MIFKRCSGACVLTRVHLHRGTFALVQEYRSKVCDNCLSYFSTIPAISLSRPVATNGKHNIITINITASTWVYPPPPHFSFSPSIFFSFSSLFDQANTQLSIFFMSYKKLVTDENDSTVEIRDNGEAILILKQNELSIEFENFK